MADVIPIRRKIAVGDLGEFWYGDYKEPFIQLEGAVPGYPRGVLLKDDQDRPLCAYCGRTFDNLGKHTQARHGLTATQYKDEVGLLQKSALVSEKGRQDRIAARLRNPESVLRLLSHRRSHPETSRQRIGQRTEEFRNKTGTCREQLLARAKVVAQSGPLTQKRLMAYGIRSPQVARYWGTLDALREAVGRYEGRHRPWKDADLREALTSLAADIGRVPSDSDLRRFGLPAFATFVRHFGTWADALRTAGLDPRMLIPDGHDLDVSILTAYAIHGSAVLAARQTHVDRSRVWATLHRYGFPFPIYGQRFNGVERRAWAADMVIRLTGTEAAV